jgi:DNA-binding transcriptional LysR family regulator
VLERELGVALVDRRGYAYRLTAAGRSVANRAAQVESSVNDVQLLARSLARTSSGHVRISGPPALTAHFVAPRLLALQQRCPELSIGLTGEVREADLTGCEVDIALRLDRPTENAIVGRKLATVEYALYGSKEYLATHSPAAWRFLGADDSQGHCPQRAWLKEASGVRGLWLQTNDLAGLAAAVRAGLGVAILPKCFSRRAPVLQDVSPSPVPSRELWIAFHRDAARIPAVRTVADHLSQIITSERSHFR